MNLNDLLFGSRSISDVPAQLRPALMPPGVLAGPQPDMNQYDMITGGGVLSPDISMNRPDGTIPVSPLEYNPNGPAIGVLPGTQLGPNQEGVPGPAFGNTMDAGGFVGAPYAGAEVDVSNPLAMTQGGPQAGSPAPVAATPAPAPQASPAAPVARPAPMPSQPPMAAPAAPTITQASAPAPALKQGGGVLNSLYEAVGGDRLWNSKQGSKELLALGAGILTGSNLMDGLGRGAAAVAAVRSNTEANERDQSNEAYMRDFRERQLQQQMKIAEANQAMRMAIIEAQIKGRQDLQDTKSNPKAAEAAATLDYNLDRVNRFMTTMDEKKEDLNSWWNTGLVGRGKQMVQSAAGSNDEVYLLKKDLINWSVNILGELAKNFKPLSNDERRFLERGIPNEGASVEEWKQFLNEAKRHLSTQRSAVGKQPAQGEQPSPQAQPQPQGDDPLGLRR